MKFGVESLLDNESVSSGRKTTSAVKNKGSDPILDILAGHKKSNSVSDWLTGENERPDVSNDWMNIAKSRQVAANGRPKTSSDGHRSQLPLFTTISQRMNVGNSHVLILIHYHCLV